MTVRFLKLDDVIRIQQRQLEQDGGLAGVRDRGLLESAVMQPMATFAGEFLHDDIAHMAAAYCFHIVKNHPFIDANKRAGLMSALSFFRVNGILIRDAEDQLYDATMAVAEGTLSKAGLADLFRQLADPSV